MAGWSFSTKALGDFCLVKYKACKDGICDTAMKLIHWKVADKNGEQNNDADEAEHEQDIQEGKSSLQEQVDMIIFLKWGSARYDVFFKDVANKYANLRQLCKLS